MGIIKYFFISLLGPMILALHLRYVLIKLFKED